MMLGDTLLRTAEVLGGTSVHAISGFVEFDCEGDWTVNGQILRNQDMNVSVREDTLTVLDTTLQLEGLTATHRQDCLILTAASGASISIINEHDEDEDEEMMLEYGYDIID